MYLTIYKMYEKYLCLFLFSNWFIIKEKQTKTLFQRRTATHITLQSSYAPCNCRYIIGIKRFSCLETIIIEPSILVIDVQDVFSFIPK